MMKYLSREIVNILGKKYKLVSLSDGEHSNMNDALSYLMINIERNDYSKRETNVSKINIPLPFCGVINKKCCQGIRLNYGLYTQCINIPTVYDKKFPVCKTCNNQIEKNSNEQPNYGYINDRLEQKNEFRDPKGRTPVKYANILDKLNISRAQAQSVAQQQGLTIPEEEFIIKKSMRGRPKKDTTADDTASESSFIESIKKKRGRPKKNKDVVYVDQLSSKTESDSEENVYATPIKLDNNTKNGYIIVSLEEAEYLLGDENILYDITEHKPIGTLNKKEKRIEYI